jgi:predicted HTH domain antitoxin
MAQVEIHMTLPEEILALAQLGKEEVAAEMQRLLLIALVRDGRVAYGKAAELLGVSQAEFLTYMARHQVSPFQFTPDELAKEMEPLE